MIRTTLKGEVTKYKGDGRKLGYPTANLAVVTELQDGVYFGYGDLGEWKHHQAIIFVGVPTTMGESLRRVEAHLLDIPDQDYYNLQLELSIEFFYRANKTFANVDELVAAMKQDESAAREWFASQI